MCDSRLPLQLQYLVLAFGLLPSIVFAWFTTNISGLCVRPMGRTHDPETLVANQAKTTLGNNPKTKTN